MFLPQGISINRQGSRELSACENLPRRLAGRYAAVDLGSNNFQMLLVDVIAGELRVVDRLKHKVQLLQGFQSGELSADSMRRSLDVLAHYAELLAPLPRANIAVKGTFALREALNREAFTRPARDILGVPVDVISGEDEARLIDVGVSRHLDMTGRVAAGQGRSLVIDIGGGSTEFALSRQSPKGRLLESSLSLPLGCVSLSEAWFQRPELVGTAYHPARRDVLATCGDQLLPFRGADVLVGTSGILESILTVCEANGFSHGAITRLALHAVESALTEGRWVADLGLPGLAPERADLFPAGVAILSAVMETLRAERVHFSDATLPLGILYQMLRLDADPDPRSAAVRSLIERFQIDSAQADRVRNRAVVLLRSARPGVDSRHLRLLEHAALLHEIGLSVSPQGYHRHGAYLLQHCSLRGYEPDDRQALTWLVRAHRRSLPASIEAMSQRLRYPDLAAILTALRLAVVLERSRDAADEPVGTLDLTATAIRLSLPAAWLKTHQLSSAGLQEEKILLARQGYRLEVTESR